MLVKNSLAYWELPTSPLVRTKVLKLLDKQHLDAIVVVENKYHGNFKKN